MTAPALQPRGVKIPAASSGAFRAGGHCADLARSASTCPSKESICYIGGICPPNPLTRMPFLPPASSGASWHDFVKRHVEARHLAVHDELVIVDHLDAFDGADASPVAAGGGVFAARVVLIAPQGMIVHDIFGGELAVAVVERHALV